MDNKNLLSIAGLVVFLLLWQVVVIPNIPEDIMYEKAPASSGNLIQSSSTPTSAPPSPEETTAFPTAEGTQIKEKVSQLQPELAPVISNLPESITTVETDVFTAHFTSKGGRLVHLSVKDYHPATDSQDDLIIMDGNALGRHKDMTERRADMESQLESSDGGQTLTYWNDRERVIYRFNPGSHFFDLEIQDLGNGQDERVIHFPNVEPDPSASRGAMLNRGNLGAIYHLYQREYGDNSAATAPSSILTSGILANSPPGDLIYAGFRNPYFGFFIEPGPQNDRAHTLKFQGEKGQAVLELTASGAPLLQYRVYAGPIKKSLLYAKDELRYGPLFNYTGINVIIHFLLWLLELYNSIPFINMGVAILMLTLTVKAVLFPLNLKAQSSMFMMSKIGPDIKALQEKYKNDRQQMGVEQMKLFKDNGVNPLAGCLPMFIQMPVFISLFSTIGEGFALRHAPFIGWIQDLSAPDRFSTMPFDLPLLGNGDGTTNLNLLVLLYVITMLAQQSMMPKSTEPQQQQMQKTMKFMMIGFAFILYNYSSGLMLYFVGSNTLGMIESWYIRNKVIPAMDAKRQKKT